MYWQLATQEPSRTSHSTWSLPPKKGVSVEIGIQLTAKVRLDYSLQQTTWRLKPTSKANSGKTQPKESKVKRRTIKRDTYLVYRQETYSGFYCWLVRVPQHSLLVPPDETCRPSSFRDRAEHLASLWLTIVLYLWRSDQHQEVSDRFTKWVCPIVRFLRPELLRKHLNQLNNDSSCEDSQAIPF